MKKYILSLLVIGTFGLYLLNLHFGGISDVAIIPPAPTTISTDTSSEIPSSNIPPPKKSDTQVTVAPTRTSSPTGQYKDGSYTGMSADAYYGNIQVEATISGGKLTDVQFLDYPQDQDTSVQINTQAMPYLRQEAIRAQSAKVNTVSGASDSSGAFRQSLASALSKARNS